jgi:hypothetical protein
MVSFPMLALWDQTMRVLVACEFSGRVRDAFTRRGHTAVSCDLTWSETVGLHYKGDVRDILSCNWDLMIAHPPCQYLTASGGQWWHYDDVYEKQQRALDFVELLLTAPIPRIALENPPGAIGRFIRPADQYIHPYHFGIPYSKKTGLWLRNLPKLKPTNNIYYKTEEYPFIYSYAHTQERRSKDRSRTFPEIAEAMADQWGALEAAGNSRMS